MVKTVSMYGIKREEYRVFRHIKGYTRIVKGKPQKVRGYDKFQYRTRPISTRFNFKGTPKELEKAVALAKKRGFVPRKRFMTVKAKSYLKKPEKYEGREKWEEDISEVETPPKKTK